MFGIVERALDFEPLGRRNGAKNLPTFVFVEIAEDRRGVVALKLANAFGHDICRQAFDDFFTELIRNFDECGEIKIVAHKGDQPRS